MYIFFKPKSVSLNDFSFVKFAPWRCMPAHCIFFKQEREVFCCNIMLRIFFFDTFLVVFSEHSSICYHQIHCMGIYNKVPEIQWFYPIITVYKRHPFTLCMIQSKISGRTYAAVLLMKHPYARIFSGIFITNIARPILAAIVNK